MKTSSLKASSLALFLVVSACSSDVDLDLTPQGPPGAPDAPDPEPPPASFVPAWSMSDLPDRQIEHTAWAPGGDLLVSDLVFGEDVGEEEVVTSFLRRFDRDGALRWVSELPMLHDGGGSYTAFDSATDGTVVTGVSFDPHEWANDSTAPPAEIRWLDAEGAVTASVALTGSTAGGHDDVVMVNSVVALPDGGVALAGVSGTVSGPAVVARLDVDGEVLWTVPIEWWSPDTLGNNFPWGPNAATDLTLTADGGLVLHGRYYAYVAVGDRSAANPVGYEVAGAVYVTRIELDGGVSWLQSIHDLHLAQTGYTSGLALTDDGHVMVAGMVDVVALVGDLELEVEGDNRHYAAELDADGHPVSLVELQYPEGIEWGFVGQTMVMRGGQLLLAGQVGVESTQEPFLTGFQILVAAHDADGAVQSTFTTEVEGHPFDAYGYVYSSAVSSEGRLALGGGWAGWADFGQGPVSTPETGDEHEPHEGAGYVAVFDPPAPVD